MVQSLIRLTARPQEINHQEDFRERTCLANDSGNCVTTHVKLAARHLSLAQGRRWETTSLQPGLHFGSR